uniref:Uncharacterized protein n=1 Tax=Lotharella globosa TaxID=91324 RepID=A0A6U3EM42_9EUKA|mmetsp:Transcript_7797/g.15039  ORF Transcript_7797/g.15039 Transcript_7797/m.15039 type:complete len:276 (+) Transcript_7797:109-936(+)
MSSLPEPPVKKGIFLRGMWRYDELMTWEECSTCSDASCGSLYFYWRLEKLKADGSNLPLYPRSQPPEMDTERYLVIKSSGYYPSEQDDESKMVQQHLVRQGYVDLELGKVVICSHDDEPWGLTLYTADIVRQGAGAGRVSGKFLVMGANYTPFMGSNGRMCGPDGEWFLAPSQGSVSLMRQLLATIASRKERAQKIQLEQKKKMLPSVEALLKSAKLAHFAQEFEKANMTTEGLIKAIEDHSYFKTITLAAGMKIGQAARFKRRIKEFTIECKKC